MSHTSSRRIPQPTRILFQVWQKPQHSTPAFCRSEASYRRTKKKLRVTPDPSFGVGTDPEDHIIYNPPSSAPSVYHTPLLFLPKNDPRRRLLTSLPTRSPSSTVPTDGADKLPPPVRPPYEKKYHLKQQDLDEMRRLRRLDPWKWTKNAIARKFDCSAFFVGLVCPSAVKRKEFHQEYQKAREKWGLKKIMAREDQARRRETWGKVLP